MPKYTVCGETRRQTYKNVEAYKLMFEMLAKICKQFKKWNYKQKHDAQSIQYHFWKKENK